MNKPFYVALAGALLGCNTSPAPRDVVQSDAADSSSLGVRGDEYCSNVPRPNCVAPAVATCGVCVTPPEDPTNDRLRRTSCSSLSGTREYCDNAQPPTPVNLSCFDPAMRPQAQDPRMVTVYGVVDVFGNGGDSDHILVEIYRVNADGSPGQRIGSAVSDVSLPYHEEEDELNSSGMVVQHRRLGAFQIPNVPTETPLIVRTIGDPNTPGTQELWGHAIYDYTMPIRNSMIAPAPATTGISGDAVRIRPRVISNSDWNTLPNTATLVTGIPPGHGAIAGEVHDCDDVRLANAMVYAEPAPNFSGSVYFSDNDSHPLPDTSRATHGTQLLGLYAMLDLNPGPVRVAALGYDDHGQLVHVGSYSARIFPDAVTVVTLRGLRPWQLNP